MRVVVTGGAGFIGAHLCRELAARPGIREVVAFDDLSTGSAANLAGAGGAVRLVLGSVLDREHLEEVVAGADAVVHLAARPSVSRALQDPVASHQVNVTGTVFVLEACRRRRLHLIVASSSQVYGTAGRGRRPPRPLNPYGAGKLAAEAYALAYGTAFGLPTLALRLFNVYGPLQQAGHAHAAVIPAFVAAALRGEPVRVHGDGRQRRDFTYVGSVVRVLADAVARRVTCPAPVDVAFGTPVSLLELARLVSEVTGTPLELRHEPPRPGDSRAPRIGGVPLRLLFPDVTPVPLRIGLERTVAWFRDLLAREPAA
ncbi:NDP-sugar dehydratase or epimerase [Thermopolyspora flexuosa]|uniref:UDP-glucose 4-epimerase n=1 Tax=Thermopolyspora flexuosa TaxID=103836 RepID=A0A543IWH8_9ACTN|nr:NAD-dependent epimerase/dehydratase family protein [Thermopolyspora flexuosa]TQM74907.1 UDP-glucose 4-epimerase [Thermopolyspora flexuosa]GGM79836.1 NDP-sugar dehydratase or epimerase [Thermopolyspora flexuosa]